MLKLWTQCHALCNSGEENDILLSDMGIIHEISIEGRVHWSIPIRKWLWSIRKVIFIHQGSKRLLKIYLYRVPSEVHMYLHKETVKGRHCLQTTVYEYRTSSKLLFLCRTLEQTLQHNRISRTGILMKEVPGNCIRKDFRSL